MNVFKMEEAQRQTNEMIINKSADKCVKAILDAVSQGSYDTAEVCISRLSLDYIEKELTAKGYKVFVVPDKPFPSLNYMNIYISWSNK